MNKLIIEDFVYEHDLHINIGVSAKNCPHLVSTRFHLTLPEVSVANGEVVREYFIGRGDTIEEAAVDYARQVSGKPLTINSYCGVEKHLKAPVLTFK